MQLLINTHIIPSTVRAFVMKFTAGTGDKCMIDYCSGFVSFSRTFRFFNDIIRQKDVLDLSLRVVGSRRGGSREMEFSGKLEVNTPSPNPLQHVAVRGGVEIF